MPEASSGALTDPEVKQQLESVGAKYVDIELKQAAAAGGGYAKELSDRRLPAPSRSVATTRGRE